MTATACSHDMPRASTASKSTRPSTARTGPRRMRAGRPACPRRSGSRSSCRARSPTMHVCSAAARRWTAFSRRQVNSGIASARCWSSCRLRSRSTRVSPRHSWRCCDGAGRVTSPANHAMRAGCRKPPMRCCSGIASRAWRPTRRAIATTPGPAAVTRWRTGACTARPGSTAAPTRPKRWRASRTRSTRLHARVAGSSSTTPPPAARSRTPRRCRRV